MAINSRKIAAFLKLISGLPTKPNATAGLTDTQLKAWWDSSPEELRVALNGLIDDLSATTDGASGADNVGATAISGLAGTTVQALLESIKGSLDTDSSALTTHKTSTDHDGRYFTETEVTALIAGLQSQITTDAGNLTTHKTSGDHDQRYYVKTAVDNTVTLLQEEDSYNAEQLMSHIISSDHDSRYFTETEVNALLASAATAITNSRKLSATGDFTGTLNGWPIVAADPGLSTTVAGIQTDLQGGVVNAPIVGFGMNSKIAHTGKVPALPKLSIVGQSYTNLLGKDGNCEDVSKWSTFQSTLALDTTNKVFGSNGIKTTIASNNAGLMNKLKSTITAFDASKYYLVSAYIKNGNATFVELKAGISSIGVTDATKYTRVMVKLTPAQASSLYEINVGVVGVVGQYAYVDGIMVNEISAADYALTEAQLLAKYPYVDSYACLQNPYLEVRHDNLVRNGNGEEGVGRWTASNTNISIVVDSGKLKVVTNSSGGGAIYQKVPVKKNTSYYWKVNVTGGLAKQVYAQDFTTALLAGDGTFNSGTNEFVYAELIFFTASQTGYADSIHLIEGTVAPTSYKPCRLERCVVEGKFTSDDTLTLENGEVSGLSWWKHKTLYGKDYAWQVSDDGVGFKRIYVNEFINYIVGDLQKSLCVKYDGKILYNYSSVNMTSADQTYPYSGGLYHITAADVDTGWAELISPNADEVRAFCNGWKATANNGTRYTAWASVVDASVSPNQTIDYVKAAIASNYEGYTLHYRLLVPEPLTDANIHVHGDIPKLDVGDNYVYLDAGIVLDEVANPILDGASMYNINNSVYPDSKLKNKAESFYGVYKNNNADEWTKYDYFITSYGALVQKAVANFDANAIYQVDYKILATQAPTVGTPTLSYAQDVYTAISDLAEVVQNKQNQDSALDALVDASVYEEIRAVFVTGRALMLDSGTHPNIFLYIPYTRKKTTPTITLRFVNTFVTLVLANGSYQSVPISDFELRVAGSPTNNYRNGVIISVGYKGTDPTVASSAGAYGMYTFIDITADCRGRI